jgi:hypothetical protein
MKSSGLTPQGGAGNPRKFLVRMGRLELPRPCERWNLNPVRLPIPPHPRAQISFRVTSRAGFRRQRLGLGP